jgi:hypothetical protein
MSTTTKYELLEALRQRYLKASRHIKKRILDEFCSIADYNRKYSIRLFNSTVSPKNISNLSKRGRKKVYDDPMILDVLTTIWQKTNMPCSKRLKQIIPLWLPFFPNYTIPEDIKEKLLAISPASIDRIMGHFKSKYSKLGLSTTKPGSILKKHIPIKTAQWDEKKPGFLEADTVAHCGSAIDGTYVFTVNCVDIATGWTEQRATWGKGEKGVAAAVKDIENAIPFDLLGFDCDNGSEFLNWHLYRFLTNDRKKPINMTRSRAYQKNDNAHIENKNWTHIRQYLGYQRFDKPELVDLLNDLYTSEWNLYFNFFIPSMKLIDKYREGSRIIKKHAIPKTPYQRLIESEHIDQNAKSELTERYLSLDPFQLQERMMSKIKTIIRIVNTP